MNEIGPQGLKPEDSWVRGNQLDRLARGIANADEQDIQWNQLYLGDAAMKLMRGCASAQDVNRVMSYVIAQSELDIQMGTRQMLEISDTTSEEYRTLHFNTRVSAGIINRINQLVRDGLAAAANLQQDDKGDYDGN